MTVLVLVMLRVITLFVLTYTSFEASAVILLPIVPIISKILCYSTAQGDPPNPYMYEGRLKSSWTGGSEPLFCLSLHNGTLPPVHELFKRPS
jgi:hypothetical protein